MYCRRRHGKHRPTVAVTHRGRSRRFVGKIGNLARAPSCSRRRRAVCLLLLLLVVSLTQPRPLSLSVRPSSSLVRYTFCQTILPPVRRYNSYLLFSHHRSFFLPSFTAISDGRRRRRRQRAFILCFSATRFLPSSLNKCAPLTTCQTDYLLARFGHVGWSVECSSDRVVLLICRLE